MMVSSSKDWSHETEGRNGSYRLQCVQHNKWTMCGDFSTANACESPNVLWRQLYTLLGNACKHGERYAPDWRLLSTGSVFVKCLPFSANLINDQQSSVKIKAPQTSPDIKRLLSCWRFFAKWVFRERQMNMFVNRIRREHKTFDENESGGQQPGAIIVLTCIGQQG